MTEALPEEEPSVLISAKALRILADKAADNRDKWMDADAADCWDAIEEAESALERYK